MGRIASSRAWAALLIVSTCGLSWLAMQVVHELGHCAAAWATGGAVARVALKPQEFSRTDLRRNPRPLTVAWGGPLFGALAPIAIWQAIRPAAPRHAFLFRFFAGFCLVANGAYLAGGAWLSVGDAGDLLRHGARFWQLLAFGLPAMSGGLYLWNGLGPRFGLGPRPRAVDRRVAIAAAAALAALIAAEVVGAALFGAT